MVQSMDRQIGRVVRTLKDLDLTRETLVFFCSDNGPTGPGRAGPLRGRKGSVWEGGHRVPAIAWWPGRIQAGSTSDALAMTMDLMPTLLELSHTEKPAGLKLDGKSLVPVLLEGKGWEKERTVYWNWPHRGNRAIREGPWKLVLNEGGIDEPKLFNLARDLGEEDDLAGDYREKVERMRQQFAEWEREVAADATPQPKEKLTPPEWLR